ncbi:MAG: hypothetical protein ACOC7J_06655, partial [Armatimonadota bacterium]
MSPIIAILGASDPEMQAIRGLLEESDIPIIQATADGRPVHPGSAYRADPVTVPDGSTVWRIECEPAAIHGANKIVVIDHHRPGDPGYGRPPAEFLSASSLGQVIAGLAKLRRLPQRPIEIEGLYLNCDPRDERGSLDGEIPAEEWEYRPPEGFGWLARAAQYIAAFRAPERQRETGSLGHRPRWHCDPATW